MSPSLVKDYETLSEKLLAEFDSSENETNIKQNSKVAKEEDDGYTNQIVWRNIIIFIYMHVASLYGIYYAFFYAQWKTWIWTYFLTLISTQGTGAGVHRLWAHRAYKAKLPLRIILMIFQTHCLQNHIYEWCRDHRAHHKYADTSADPHNSKRGFFFCHMGWLLVKKHKDVLKKGKTLDLSDLEADPVVVFQKRYYLILAPLFAFLIPAWVPWYFWNENIHVAWCLCSMLRYSLSLHGTWLVNSAAHLYGAKPYDKGIMAAENLAVSYITNGEGWHNYHHTFPWDYRAAELGSYSGNWSTAFIDIFSKIGWAYDLKTVSPELIKRRVLRTGDGSRKFDRPVENNENNLWGWGDEDMKIEDICLAEIRNRRTG